MKSAEAMFKNIVKKLGIKDFSDEIYEKALSEYFDGDDSLRTALHDIQSAKLINSATDFESKVVVANICRDWSDPKDIVELRTIFGLMKQNRFEGSGIIYLIECMHGSASKATYMLRDAARIARAEEISFNGDDFVKDYPTEEEIAKERKQDMNRNYNNGRRM